MAERNRLAQSDSPKNSHSSSDDAARIVKSLNGFYDLVGHKPDEPGTLTKMAAYLIGQGATPSMVSAALDRCVKECRYPVRLPDITQRVVGMEVSQIEAEMRAAWDTTIKFVQKYVGCDGEGRYGPEFGLYGAWGYNPETGKPRHPGTYPELPRRILDCVRRTGDWLQYKRMTEEDQPFQQKRFFEEYQAWQAVEPVAQRLAALIEPTRLKELSASKEMNPMRKPKPSPGGFPERVPSRHYRDPATEKARLAAHLKNNPHIGGKANVK